MHKTSSGQCSYFFSTVSTSQDLFARFQLGEVVSTCLSFGVWCVIYQTQATLFHSDIHKPKRELKIRTQQSIFDEIRGVWIADEALSLVFDISSQLKQKLRSKRGNKILKIYANKYRYPNLLHGCDFLCFNIS